MTPLSSRPASADVLVVGAGPAGSAAAEWAARAGLDVVLADAATFPRDKTCGDGLTPRAIREMHRQVGVLRMDEQGLAKRGVLVRHLIMPGGIAGTDSILRFLAEEISRDTYVNLMDQYYPAGRVDAAQFVEINRRIESAEFEAAREAARKAGLWRLDGRRARLGLWN